MGMDLTASNLFQFLTYISPFLLMFTFTLLAFMDNEPLRAVAYVGTVMISTGLVSLITLGERDMTPTNPLCNLWNVGYLNSGGVRPSLSFFFITYTLVYMILPMIFSGYINWPIFGLLLLLLVSDGTSKWAINSCVPFRSIMVAFILALVTSTLFTSLLYSLPFSDKLLYFSHVPSNKVHCARPSKQTFKCAVYKNGKLIQNIN